MNPEKRNVGSIFISHLSISRSGFQFKHLARGDLLPSGEDILHKFSPGILRQNDRHIPISNPAGTFSCWGADLCGRERREARKKQVAVRLEANCAFSVPLLVIDGLVCFWIMISASLRHSAQLIRLVPVKCAVATAAIIGLPMLVLIFYRPKN